MIPLVLFILPCLFIVIIGPAGIQIIDTFRRLACRPRVIPNDPRRWHPPPLVAGDDSRARLRTLHGGRPGPQHRFHRGFRIVVDHARPGRRGELCTDWMRLTRATPWIPVGEALIVALILANASPVRRCSSTWRSAHRGRRSPWPGHHLQRTALTEPASPWSPPPRLGNADGELIRFAVPWLVMGLGVGPAGQLAVALDPRPGGPTGAVRRHASADGAAPPARERRHLGLDAPSLATELERAMRRPRVPRDARSSSSTPTAGRVPCSGSGRHRPPGCGDHLPESDRTPGAAVVPLRGAHAVLGYCVLVGVARWTQEMEDRAREVADDSRCDSTLRCSSTRSVTCPRRRNATASPATCMTASRRRSSRSGYLVDEIESISQDRTSRARGVLRDEITRLVTELRFSIFDLRHHVDATRLTAPSPTTCAKSAATPPPRPSGPRRVDRTCRRAADRAAAHRPGGHQQRPQARPGPNLWVTLVSDGTDLRLEVEDDGIGDACPAIATGGCRRCRSGPEVSEPPSTSDHDQAAAPSSDCSPNADHFPGEVP